MRKEIKDLFRRYIEISYRHNLSHLGSGLSCLETIYDIYVNHINTTNNIFILSNGHAALALYVVLEKIYGIDAEFLYEKHGTHPNRDIINKIYCSTGSLGLGITIATGMAMANPNIEIHCMISDGECAEGSVWESLRFITEQNLKNIKIYAIVNGYSAYKQIDKKYLIHRLYAFLHDINVIDTSSEQFPFLKGLSAHYHVMTEEDYKIAINQLQGD